MDETDRGNNKNNNNILPSPVLATACLVIADAIEGLLGAQGALPKRMHITDDQRQNKTTTLAFRVQDTARSVKADKLQKFSNDFLPIVQQVVQRTIKEGIDVEVYETQGNRALALFERPAAHGLGVAFRGKVDLVRLGKPSTILGTFFLHPDQQAFLARTDALDRYNLVLTSVVFVSEAHLGKHGSFSVIVKFTLGNDNDNNSDDGIVVCLAEKLHVSSRDLLIVHYIRHYGGHAFCDKVQPWWKWPTVHLYLVVAIISLYYSVIFLYADAGKHMTTTDWPLRSMQDCIGACCMLYIGFCLIVYFHLTGVWDRIEEGGIAFFEFCGSFTGHLWLLVGTALVPVIQYSGMHMLVYLTKMQLDGLETGAVWLVEAILSLIFLAVYTLLAIGPLVAVPYVFMGTVLKMVKTTNEWRDATTEMEKRNVWCSLAKLLLLSFLIFSVCLWYVHLTHKDGYYSTIAAVMFIKWAVQDIFGIYVFSTIMSVALVAWPRRHLMPQWRTRHYL